MSMLPANIHKRLECKEWKPPENNQFVFKDENGKSFRCRCGCNVFHKEWEPPYGEIAVCNACDKRYELSDGTTS